MSNEAAKSGQASRTRAGSNPFNAVAAVLRAQEIAALVPMPQLLEALGFAVNERTRRAVCRLHSGSNPTAFSWREDGLWFCHSCGQGGDKIALVQAVRSCSFREAVEFCAALAGVQHLQRISHQEIGRAKRERELLEHTARLLADAEAKALREVRETLWALQDLRRRAGARLCAIHRGARERWAGETEWCWEGLKVVSDQLPRADVAYCTAAFSGARVRARFALHPESRAGMIETALEQGYVIDEKGYRFKVALQ